MARDFVIPNNRFAALKTGTHKAIYNFQATDGTHKAIYNFQETDRWRSDWSNNLHGLVQSQFYGRISAERINGGTYFRLSRKFDSI